MRTHPRTRLLGREGTHFSLLPSTLFLSMHNAKFGLSGDVHRAAGLTFSWIRRSKYHATTYLLINLLALAAVFIRGGLSWHRQWNSLHHSDRGPLSLHPVLSLSSAAENSRFRSSLSVIAHVSNWPRARLRHIINTACQPQSRCVYIARKGV